MLFHRLWYVFGSEVLPSRAVALSLPASEQVDVFLPIPHPEASTSVLDSPPVYLRVFRRVRGYISCRQ